MDRLDDELSTLEQCWIAAEAEADEAKWRAERALMAAEEVKRFADERKPEVTLLLGEATEAARRRDEAEAEAAAAFERFWSKTSAL